MGGGGARAGGDDAEASARVRRRRSLQFAAIARGERQPLLMRASDLGSFVGGGSGAREEEGEERAFASPREMRPLRLTRTVASDSDTDSDSESDSGVAEAAPRAAVGIPLALRPQSTLTARRSGEDSSTGGLPRAALALALSIQQLLRSLSTTESGRGRPVVSVARFDEPRPGAGSSLSFFDTSSFLSRLDALNDAGGSEEEDEEEEDDDWEPKHRPGR